MNINRILLIVLTVFFISSTFAQNFKFAGMSDSRGRYTGVNDSVFIPLVNHLMENNGDIKFLVFPGDLISGNKNSSEETRKQLEHWKDIMQPVYDNPNLIGPKIWLSVGNHEIQKTDDENNFRQEFPYMYMNGPEDEKGLTYSFDYDSVHFVFVTTDKWHYSEADEGEGSRDWHYVKHLDWLENDLKTARENGSKYIFVMGHETAFPIGGHLRDGLPNLGMNFKLPLDSTRKWYLNQRDMFWKVLEKYNVSAYLCGHEHLYGRESINGIYQIITGSCGAPLYHFNPEYGDNPEKKQNGQELTYNEALPYYKVLDYNYGPGGNAQASKDFVGKRAFVYVVVNVTPKNVEVETYGAEPKEGINNLLGTQIHLLDKFIISK